MNSNSGLNCDRALDFTTLENKGVGQQIASEKMQSRPNEEHRWGEVVKTSSLFKIDSRDHKLLVIQTLFSEKGVDLNLSEFSLGEMEGIPMYIQHSLNMNQQTGLIQEVRFIAQKTGSFLRIIHKLRNVEKCLNPKILNKKFFNLLIKNYGRDFRYDEKVEMHLKDILTESNKPTMAFKVIKEEKMKKKKQVLLETQMEQEAKNNHVINKDLKSNLKLQKEILSKINMI